MQRLGQQHAQQLDHYQSRLLAQSPASHLQQARSTLSMQQQRITQSLTHQLKQRHDQINALARTLDAHSPLKTLERGYAIAHHDDTIVTKASQVTVGDTINLQVHQGTLACTVDKVE